MVWLLDGVPLMSMRIGKLHLVPVLPNVWTDCNLVLVRVTGVSSSGAGFFAHLSENCWGDRSWGHVDGVRADDGVPSCRGF